MKLIDFSVSRTFMTECGHAVGVMQSIRVTLMFFIVADSGALCQCDYTFSRFSRTPTCDRQTDTDTDRHRPMASTADA